MNLKYVVAAEVEQFVVVCSIPILTLTRKYTCHGQFEQPSDPPSLPRSLRAGRWRKTSTLNDKVVMAGFVEQPVHPVLAALTMNTRPATSP